MKLNSSNLSAYFLYAFIAMAGLSYINFLPALVNALAGNIGFTEVQAGEIVALNGYGGLVGSLIAIFMVDKISWKPVLVKLFVVLIIVDISTAWINHYSLMLSWRFFAGLLGGLTVGINIAMLARLKNPDRAFGLLLFVQFFIGSLVIFILPDVEPISGPYAVFYIMASIVMLSLVFLCLVPNIIASNIPNKPTIKSQYSKLEAILLLLAIMAYQVAASAIWAYVALIGREAQISAENVSTYIAATGMLGLLGALLPVITGNKYGRFYWIFIGLVLSITAALLLRFSHLAWLYLVSMALLFFCWPAILSFLLAVTADWDTTGKLSTTANLISFTGLATGPMLAANLLNYGDFTLILNTCAAIFVASLLLLFKPVFAIDKTQSIPITE